LEGVISENRENKAVIRPYRPTDRDAVYDVCVRTADSGEDVTGRYRDPNVVADVFAGPYVHLEPGFAIMLDNGERVVGYAIGTPDTARFVRAYRREWLPLAGARRPLPTGQPADLDEGMAVALHDPERMIRPELAPYPAHLHIDLLPEYQRSGHGSALMDTLFGALRSAGADAVHLAMYSGNTRARAFYDRIGFHEITVDGAVTYLGRSCEPISRPGSPRTA
jgi:GNAT superfamily N-acetyltransferase